MKVEIIKFGHQPLPVAAYSNDAGLDIYMPCDGVVKHGINKIPLGVGFKLPAGYCGLVYTRSSLTAKGFVPMLAPIDCGYTGEVHFLVYNTGDDYYYKAGDRLCQMVVHQIAHISPVVDNSMQNRQDRGFGSTRN